MTTKQLSRYLLDEGLCESYLREAGILKTFDACPSCKSTHFDRIRRQRYMCYECRYEWNIRRNSFIEGKHLDLSTFIACMKFFSDDIPAYKCADEIEISRDTVNNLYTVLREILVGPVKKMPVESNQLFVCIKKEAGEIVFSLEAVGKDIEAAKLSLIRSKNTDGAFHYILEYKNLRAKSFLKKIDRIDGLDDFYRYCQECLLNFRGRDIKLLVWKLQELTFRYNYRHVNIYDLLVRRFSSILEG